MIRLEERLRLEKLLPAELQSRIPSFSTDQLIGMRFAADAELPALARKVLGGRPRLTYPGLPSPSESGPW